ncbi:hypothetical protein Dimus_000591 [Dionaea muscipula]
MEKVRPVGLEADEKREAVMTASPTAEELDQQVDDLLARPFVSDALSEGDTEKNSSDKLVIPMGSDRGMSLMLRDEAFVEPGSSKIVEIDKDDGERENQRNGKEILMVGEEDNKADEEGKRDVGPFASKRRSSKRSLFASQRLRVPSGRMVRSCMNSMMAAANRVTIRALQNVPLKHKFVCLYRTMAEVCFS